MPPARLTLLTALAITGFAANSILCRLALAGTPSIDPLTFTAVRIVAGGLVLVALARQRARAGTLGSALALVAYAVPFSLAYVRIAGGVGALLLFASVQLTMFGVAAARGERPSLRTGGGALVAALGVVVLVAPGLRAPDPIGAVLMIVAGIAWGAYTLRGREARDPAKPEAAQLRALPDPLGTTAGNFALAVPLAIGAAAVHAGLAVPVATPRGLALAVASGALASGLGYAIWYAVVPSLGTIRAAVVQLGAPILAALAAVPILDEPLSARLAVATALVVGGVATSVTARGG